MKTPAERYALALVKNHGKVEARKMIQDRLEEAVLNDRNFLLAVLESLR